MKALALSFLLIASCFGSAARTEVLRPAIRTSYSHVRPLIMLGLVDLEHTPYTFFIDMEKALRKSITGDGPISLVAWRSLRPFADRGVLRMLERGEISRGVVQVLDEQIRKLDEMLRLL